MGQVTIQGNTFQIAGDVPTVAEKKAIAQAIQSGTVPTEPEVPFVEEPPVTKPVGPKLTAPYGSDTWKIEQGISERHAIPASEGPPPPPPTVPERVKGRLFGTDMYDTMPLTRGGSTVAGAVAGIKPGLKLGKALSTAAQAHPATRWAAPAITPAVTALTTAVTSSAASTLPEVITEGLEATGVLPEGYRKKHMLNNQELDNLVIGEALVSGGFDVGIGAVKHGYRAMSQLFQLPSASGRELAERARALGINLPGTTTGSSWLNNIWTPIFGRFPLIGGPIRTRSDLAADQVIDVLKMKVMGPAILETKLGENLYKRAKSMVTWQNKRFSRKYKEMWDRADELGISLNPTHIRQEAENIMTMFQKTMGEEGALPEGWKPVAEFIEEHARKLGGPNGGPISYHKLDGFLTAISHKMATIDNPETQRYANSLLNKLRLAGLANASDPSLIVSTAGDAAPEAAARFLGDMRALDQEYAGMMKRFETSAGLKTARVKQGGLRSVGYEKPTQQTADQLFKAFENVDSPQIYKELHGIVGDRTMRELAQHRIQRAVDAAIDTSFEGGGQKTAFDPDTFRKMLGYDNPRSAKYAAMNHLIENHTNINRADLETLIEAGMALQGKEVPSMATMPARAAGIGGLKGAVRSLLPGLGVLATASGGGYWAAGLWGMALAMGSGRAVSIIIANPKAALPLKRVLAESTPHSQKIKAMMQLGRVMLTGLMDDGEIERERFADLSFQIDQAIKETYGNPDRRKNKDVPVEKLRGPLLNPPDPLQGRGPDFRSRMRPPVSQNVPLFGNTQPLQPNQRPQMNPENMAMLEALKRVPTRERGFTPAPNMR
tara:strand:+ start:1646 stop:4144 length:2499 start_codon:yes stop_codon:yes gene_type:complete